MAKQIKLAWKENCLDELNKTGSIDKTISFNKASQWLILTLTEKNIAFRVFNLGAGVKRITTATDWCPKCKGTGRI